MSVLRGIGLALAGAETALSLGIAAVAARRWARLDAGARWIAVGNAVHLAFYAITIPLVIMHRSTRLVNEAPFLLATTAELIGFGYWQPRPVQRHGVFATVPLFVAFWVVGQVIQGTTALFSPVSNPIRGALLTGVAGFTIITGVQATMERWTDHLWFWAATGYMLTSGTEVLFDPTAEMLQSYRPDVAVLIHVSRIALNLVGYGLVLRGFLLGPSRSAEPVRSPDPVTTLTLGSSGTWAIREL